MSGIIFAYIPALIGISIIAWLVYQRRVAAHTTYLTFVVALLFIILWQFTQMISQLLTGDAALQTVRVSIVFANFMTPALLLFAILFLTKTSKQAILRYAFIFVPALIFLPLSFHSEMVSDVYYRDDIQFLTTGFLYDAQAMYTIIFTFIAVLVLGVKAFKRKGKHRAALLLISSAFTIPLLVGAGINYYSEDNSSLSLFLLPLSFLIMVSIIAYAMLRYRLFDIKLAAVRGIAYACVLLTLSGIYYLTAYILSMIVFSHRDFSQVSIGPVNIILALLLAILFQPVKQFFDRMTDRVFYRDSYKSEDFFTQFGEILTSTTDLKGLLMRASNYLEATFKAEQVFFFLYYDRESDHHTSTGTHGHAHLTIKEARFLDRYVESVGRRILITDLIENGTVQRILHTHRIALVIPLRHEKKTDGYVMLGDHRSGNYTKRDLSVLSGISNELIIAIQNALSLYEVNELNATLQQRINVATKELRSSNAQLKALDQTKDEFISMASHQLRTPLTSIKGYLSMVLEGDAGKIDSQQHKLLTEAFNSSERMVRLIADFLNVSRLQTGKFTIERAPLDIKHAIRQEISNLEIIAKTRDIKMKLNVTKESLLLTGDESKLRQIMMNLIDNAIYYSHQGSTVTVNLEKSGDYVEFTVTDTGIGVPESEQSKLFSKFFRAENARKQRPDGTGVGLYLAQRVVTGHKGSIIFSSKEGEGSTFGFRLPLDKHATK